MRRFPRGPSLSKESLCVGLSLLGNGSVNTWQQRRIVGGVVFHAFRLVSKENRRLVLPRTSCNSYSLKSLVINKHSPAYYTPISHKPFWDE
jgi:hypothetical protein